MDSTCQLACRRQVGEWRQAGNLQAVCYTIPNSPFYPPFVSPLCIHCCRRVYSKLKYESGVHRVQRVPSTETSGRVHTSTATVAIMPEVDDVDVKIDPKVGGV